MEQIADFIGRENMGDIIVIIILMTVMFIYVLGCETYFRENNRVKIIIPKQIIIFHGLLFIILLLLKAGIGKTAAMGWSWWWITSPLWGPIALIIGIPLFIILVLIVGGIFCFLCYLFIKLIIFVVTKYKER